MADTCAARFPQHLMQVIQSLYAETSVMIENGGRRNQKKILINRVV
jgi:hypothetical protein